MAKLTTETTPHDRDRITYFWDRFRGVSAGINESFFGTFLLLIAIRVFEASSTQKSILTGGLWAGMFLMPVFLWVVSTLRLRSNIACMIYTCITGFLFSLSITLKSTDRFVIVMVAILIIGVQGFTLLPRILAENYDPGVRGRRVGTTIMIHGVAYLVVSQVFGLLMDNDLGNYIWLLATCAGAYFAASLIYYRMPSTTLSKPPSRFPYNSIRLFSHNTNFGKISLFWSLIEFGNIMMIPMRIEYVANDRFDIDLSNTQITWLIAIVPVVISMTTSRTWGKLFDRFRVETIQAAMGVFAILSILTFFMSTQYFWMLFSMALFGLAFGAQKILNQLWLTKVVDKDNLAEYISAFSILNGIRGIFAPILAYWLLSFMMPQSIGYVAAGTIALGIVFLTANLRSTVGN